MNLRDYTALHEPKRFNDVVNGLLGHDRVVKQKALNTIQAFMQAPEKLAPIIKSGGLETLKAQFYTTKSDIPDFLSNTFDTFNEFVNYDNRYESAFKVRTFDPQSDFFTIATTSEYFTFDELKEGGQISIKRVSADKAHIYAKSFADGFGWTWDMLADRKFGELLDVAQTMREAYYRRKSKFHYALLTDAGVANANTITWQGSGTTPTEIHYRDVTTVNLARNNIAIALKDNGLGDVLQGQYVIYYHPKMQSRLQSALGQTVPNIISPTVIGSANFVLMPTFNLVQSNGTALADTQCMMVYAGGKIQRADKQMPTIYSGTEITTASDLLVCKGRFGAGIAEPLQIQLFNLA